MKKLAAVASVFLLVAATWAVQDAPVGVVLRVEGPVRVRSGGQEAADAAVGTRLSAGDRILPGDGASALLILRGGDRVEVTEAYTVQAPQAASGGDGDMFSRTVRVLGRVASANTENLADRQGMIRPIPGEPVLIAPRNELTVMTPRPAFTWHGVEGASGYTVQIRRPESRPVRFREIDDTAWAYPDEAPALIPGVEYWWTVAPSGSGRATREQRFTVIGPGAYARVARDLRALADADLDPGGEGAFLAAVLFRDEGLYYEAAAALERLEDAGGALSADALLLKGEVLATLGRLDGARRAFDRADRTRR